MLLFVGERKSETARRKGWSWKDGRLAAKTLFDALRACGIDPTSCIFVNWFNTRQRSIIKQCKVPIIAMGYKVQSAMHRAGIAYTPMIHPAARGLIRKKARYEAHVAYTMMQIQKGVYGSELAEIT